MVSNGCCGQVLGKASLIYVPLGTASPIPVSGTTPSGIDRVEPRGDAGRLTGQFRERREQRLSRSRGAVSAGAGTVLIPRTGTRPLIVGGAVIATGFTVRGVPYDGQLFERFTAHLSGRTG